MKNKIEEQLKLNHSYLRSAELGLNDKLNKAVNDLERMTKEANNIINDNNYTLDERVNRIIHLIHWGIANMHIDGLSENSARYKAIKGQIEILNELLEENN